MISFFVYQIASRRRKFGFDFLKKSSSVWGGVVVSMRCVFGYGSQILLIISFWEEGTCAFVILGNVGGSMFSWFLELKGELNWFWWVLNKLWISGYIIVGVFFVLVWRNFSSLLVVLLSFVLCVVSSYISSFSELRASEILKEDDPPFSLSRKFCFSGVQSEL